MRDVYYHEDDYCQLELVFEVNGQFCAEQMGMIDEFSAVHKADVGWTDVYARPDNPTPLSAVNITGSDLTACMPSSMPRFDRVFTGYSTCRTECERTIAFGPHDSLVAYAEVDGNDVVTSVWFTFDLKSSDDVAVAIDLMHGLSRWPLLVADWGWSQLIRVNDSDALTHYFNERVKVFGRTHT
jgi:hypothetical protein